MKKYNRPTGANGLQSLLRPKNSRREDHNESDEQEHNDNKRALHMPDDVQKSLPDGVYRNGWKYAERLR